MKYREVKDKVKTAFESVTPDNIDNIREQVSGAEQVSVPVTAGTKKKKSILRRFILGAACIAILVLGGLGIYGYNLNYAVATEISFDVNPSMTMTVNGKGRVRSVTANNADAARVIEGLNFEGSTYEVAANAIIGAMLRTGYLSELSNSVLVSVSDGNAERSKSVEQTILAEIEHIFSVENFDGAIICQTVSDNAQLQALAAEYGITMGKASLIDKIVTASEAAAGSSESGAQVTAYTFRDLAGLTINELNVLAESLSVNLGDSASGSASTQGYIGEDRAKELALGFAGVAETDVTGSIRSEFDFESGVIVYEVSFRTSDYEYEVDVSATDGGFVAISEERESRAGSVGESLTEEEIRAAAFGKAGITDESAVTDYRTESERDDGATVYEVYFSDGTFRYELEIREDGVILSYDKKTAPSSGTGGEEGSGEITEERAREIAYAKAAELAAARGAQFDEADVREYECEKEREDGVLSYEIEFRCGKYEFEFRISATSGSVIKAEMERD